MGLKKQMDLTQAYQMKNLPSFLYRQAGDDLPPIPSTQAKVMANLVSDPAVPDLHKYKYAVCSRWYEQWRRDMGWDDHLSQAAALTALSGSFTTKTSPWYTYLDGHIWKQLVTWYGDLPGDGHYDRCTRVCVIPSRVNFEVGYLKDLTVSQLRFHPSPWYSKALSVFKRRATMVTGLGRCKHKVLNTTENVGYVEFQLRCLLNVPKEVRTRLWYQRSRRSSRSTLEPLFDHQGTLHVAINEEVGFSYTLMLELKDSQGLWPSGVPESPDDPDMEYYYVLTQQAKLTDFTTETLAVDSVSESAHNLKDSALVDLLDPVVSDSVVAHKVRACQRVESQAQECADQYNEQLNKLKQDIECFNKKQSELLAMMESFAEEKRKFDETRSEFDETRKLIQQVNKRSESVIMLNVGGYIYHTSIATLTSDPDTMLAKMFGGTYPVKQLDDGRYFIDRNGWGFPYVLDYLRIGDINEKALPDDVRMYNAVCQEMDYYQINPCKAVVEKRKVLQEVFGFSDSFFTESKDVSAE